MLLQVSDLRKKYTSEAGDFIVLDGVSLSLDASQSLAIVGESGCGKSTLLHILGTLDSADSGCVNFDGKDLLQLDQARLAKIRNRNFGFVYQAHHLVPELNVVENVMLPLLVRRVNPADGRKEAEKVLDDLGLTHRMNYSVSKLSGGEAQRVAVARALVGKPKLVLADEPTGNLDESNADKVFSLMRRLCQDYNTSLLLVTHSHFQAGRCDSMMRLHNGALEKIQ